MVERRGRREPRKRGGRERGKGRVGEKGGRERGGRGRGTKILSSADSIRPNQDLFVS